MSTHNEFIENLGPRPQNPIPFDKSSMVVPSPTRAYFSPKTSSITPTLSATLSASLTATLASKKAYITLPSIQKVISSHTTTRNDGSDVPDYDEAIANIPALDLLPPPPVYDIVNCSTSQTLLLVSSLINTILAVNDRLACPKITLFHSRAIPNISIEAYLSRILQYAPFQNEVLLIILLYFDRIGGGCKPTQVLTNTIPKGLLRQASMTLEDINQLTTPKQDTGEGGARGDESVEKGEKGSLKISNEISSAGPDGDTMEEEEPIADEIYTSSSESPVGSKLIINSFNIHRLLITSILVACKFSSDVFYPNVRYAKVGGLPLSELNQLELEFLFLSQFELNTTESELQTYGNKLLMYHQRLNGTERAAYDAITPAKGEYVRISEKKQVIVDGKPMSPWMQTTELQQHRPSSERESRPFVASGPYRDSKEIIDDDEVMSEKADDQVVSPTEWHSVQNTPVIAPTAPSTKPPIPRSNKMNLNHMIWPTNEVETKFKPSSRYGGMIMDEDAVRIEEEFNKASPPPESAEGHPKRKLQRLSSGTMEPVPAKRANTPGKGTSGDKPTSQPGSNNKNILKPLLRKIASFASHRSEATPAPEPEPAPQPPALRSHPYLVRHRISPASSSTHLADSDEITSPTTPTSATMSWHQDEYASRDVSQRGVSQAFQMKPPPPPYSGQDHDQDRDRAPRPMSQVTSHKTVNPSRIRRQHRSREPSLSSLASELTFEPTGPSLSPMSEESSRGNEPSTPEMTVAPFYFPPRPQVKHGSHLPLFGNNQSYSTAPAGPTNRRDRSDNGIHNPNGQDLDMQSVREIDDNSMQCDEHPVSPSSSDSRYTQSEPIIVSESTNAESSWYKAKVTSSERIKTEGLDVGASSSSLPSSTTKSRRTIESELADGRQWIPRHAPATTYPPVQYPHPHYVASYYPAPNTYLPQDPRRQSTAPRNPQAILPAGGNSNNKQAVAPGPRQARQFAPIRPRTPMALDEESNDRAVQPTTESSQKKKKSSSSESKSQASKQQQLRPLVPTIVAPPPYRPPFIAYPGSYGQPLRGPDGNQVRPPPPPMIMAVDYSHGGAMTAAGNVPQFLAAAPHPHGSGHPHGGAPTRLYIPVIPVMYNKPHHAQQVVMANPGAATVKTPGKTSTLAKIAPRLHRPV
ncbi:hypothetical protein BG011_004682 [Mortierella polycephala]|uniref:Cyclin-domain-containing protein n=1 Tax=Mortierella polycephala TaxID=41804 RepID=A0A9P6U9V1_9FUNG|nr:hypothetical protein BG011_004682 [Mortierella polycephala]